MRIIDAYASLHGVSRDKYVLNLVLDGVEAEGHAKIDLEAIPEIWARGGPKRRLGPGIDVFVEQDGPHKRYNSKQLAERLGVSTWTIGAIKLSNRWLHERGKEDLIFNGRYSTVRRVSDWLDSHPDFKVNRWKKDLVAEEDQETRR